MAALQEAGIPSVDPVALPSIDALGIHPSWETLLAQAVVIVVVVIAYALKTRAGAKRLMKDRAIRKTRCNELVLRLGYRIARSVAFPAAHAYARPRRVATPTRLR